MSSSGKKTNEILIVNGTLPRSLSKKGPWAPMILFQNG